MFHVDPDITKARTLDTSFYTDPSCFTASRERLFAPFWLYAGDVGMAAHNGDCHPFTLLPGFLDEPLLLARDGEGTVRCLSNVCTHRGNLLVEEPCHSQNLRCRYHGRMFGLDGSFRSMPEFNGVAGFPGPEDDLPKVALHTWGPMRFVRLAGDLDPNDSFGEMKRRLAWLPIDEFRHRPDRDATYEVKAHWALYCENYLEGFHIPFVHAGLNQVIDFGDYTTETYRFSNLQLGIAKEGEPCFDLPISSPDHGKRVAAYYYWLFPNLMFNFYPWGLSLNVVEPVSMDRTRVRFLTFLWKEDLFDTGAGSGLDVVEMEDEEVVEAVQKGVRSRFYRHGRYSPNREQGTHHFHTVLASLM